MMRSALRVEECCSWCRQPVSRCQDPACDDARTYSGVLLRGVWQEVDHTRATPPELFSSSVAPALQTAA